MIIRQTCYYITVQAIAVTLYRSLLSLRCFGLQNTNDHRSGNTSHFFPTLSLHKSYICRQQCRIYSTVKQRRLQSSTGFWYTCLFYSHSVQVLLQELMNTVAMHERVNELYTPPVRQARYYSSIISTLYQTKAKVTVCSFINIIMSSVALNFVCMGGLHFSSLH